MLSLLKQIYPYWRKHWLRAGTALFLALVLAHIKWLQVDLIKPIFDDGLGQNAQFEETFFLIMALLGLSLINVPARYFHFYFMRFIVERMSADIRTHCYRSLHLAPMKYVQQKKRGELVSTLINDTQAFANGFQGIIDFIREPLIAIYMLGLAFYRDWQLTTILFTITPILIAIFRFTAKKVRNYQEHVQNSLGQMTQAVSEGVQGLKMTKSYGLQLYMTNRFKKAQEYFFRYQMKSVRAEELASPIVQFFVSVAFGAIIIFAHTRIQQQHLTAGDFISFLAALGMFNEALRKFSKGLIKINQSRAAGERIFALQEIEPETSKGTKQIHSFNHQVEFKNISFSYEQNGNKLAVENFNLIVNKGEKVAFVGFSGSGKSTLLNLMLGLYPLQNGDILIDGVSIADISLASLRSLFGYVGQDVFLFNDSILENLKLGKELSNENLNEALDVAYCREFIEEMDNGLNTQLGDFGSRVSGGQAQRLAIARAYLVSAPILVFDEATSALDNKSEKIVQKALQKVAGDNKTVFAVAHRLSTVQDFDQIVVLQEGKLVQKGRHDQLLSSPGEYKNLYTLGVFS